MNLRNPLDPLRWQVMKDTEALGTAQPAQSHIFVQWWGGVTGIYLALMTLCSVRSSVRVGCGLVMCLRVCMGVVVGRDWRWEKG